MMDNKQQINLTGEEVSRLINAVKDDSELLILIYLMLSTGLSLGECCNLKFKDVFEDVNAPFEELIGNRFWFRITPQNCKPEWYIFPDSARDAEGKSSRRIREAINAAFEKAGIAA